MKRLMKWTFTVLALTIALAACDATKSQKKTDDSGKSDTTAVDGAAEDEDVQPNTGCD